MVDGLRLANIRTPDFANVALQGEQIQGNRENRARQGMLANAQMQNYQNQAIQFQAEQQRLAKKDKDTELKKNISVAIGVGGGVITEETLPNIEKSYLDLGGNPDLKFFTKLKGKSPEDFKKNIGVIKKVADVLGITKVEKDKYVAGEVGGKSVWGIPGQEGFTPPSKELKETDFQFAYKNRKDKSLSPGEFRSKVYVLKETISEKEASKKRIVDYTAEAKKRTRNDPDLMNDNQKRLLSKDLVTMEEKILGNPKNEAVRGAIRYFNKYSKTPYMYIWKVSKGKVFGTNEMAEKINLPVQNGKQITSEDVRFTAKKYNKTVEDVLKELGVL